MEKEHWNKSTKRCVKRDVRTRITIVVVTLKWHQLHVTFRVTPMNLQQIKLTDQSDLSFVRISLKIPVEMIS